jgi:hypothetical protein
MGWSVVAARFIARIGADDDAARRGAAPVVEVLGVAGGVVAERDGPTRGRRRRGAAHAPGLLRQPPEQLPPRALPAPPDLARQDELRAADQGARAAVLVWTRQDELARLTTRQFLYSVFSVKPKTEPKYSVN